MLNLEYITHKEFFVGKSFLPVFDWDTPDANHPLECVTLQKREDILPIINKFCDNHPELGLWIESTPGGVRGFLSKVVSKEVWKQLAEELNTDPLNSKFTNDEEGTWDVRVSNKPDKTWTAKPWFYIGINPDEFAIEQYESYLETVASFKSKVSVLYMRKHSEIKLEEMESIAWTQTYSFTEVQGQYGEHLYKVHLKKELDLSDLGTYWEGGAGCMPSFINDSYQYGVKKNSENCYWVSLNVSLIDRLEYVGVDQKQIEYDQQQEEELTDEQYQALLAQAQASVLAQQVTKATQSLLEKIKEHKQISNVKEDSEELFFEYYYVKFVFNKSTEDINFKSAPPADEEDELNELLEDLINQLSK